MPAILSYFDIPGRAEATRVALGVAGVEFEDEKMPFPGFKNSDFTALPVLQMGGTNITESITLLRFVGKLGGLYPENPLCALKVDEIVLIAQGLNAIIFSTLQERNPEKKRTLCETLIKGIVSTTLKDLTAKLAENTASPYFVGSSLTIADLQVYAVVRTVETCFMTGFPTTMIADMAPDLKALHNSVLKHPKVKAFYASKKQSKL